MSGGHYPQPYHHIIQPPPEFISPRHRLPVIPAEGPPSSTIAHAHSSPASWINKQSFSNFHENASSYTQTTPKNYSSSARSYYNEESGWSEPVSLTNPSHRVNSNEKSRIVYSNDVQQESMDLSSAAHPPSTGITSAKTITAASSTVPVNGSPVKEHLEDKPSVNGSPGRKIVSKMPSEKEAVSMIAANLLREKSTQKTIVKSPQSKAAKSNANLAPKINDTAKITKPKSEQNIPVDRVESILETMFHSDTKSSTSATSSVIVKTPTSKNLDLRGESVEKILKSPSPVRCDNLENDLEVNSIELESTKSSPAVKNTKVIDPAATNEPAKNTKVNHDKPSDDSIVKTVSKTAPSKKSDNQKPRKVSTKSSNIKDLGLTDDCDTRAVSKSVNDISNIKIEPSDAESKPKKRSTDKKSDTNKQVPGKSKNPPKENVYVEVESELEKMFAGIEDIKMDPVTCTTNAEWSKQNATSSKSNSSLSHSANATETQVKPVKKKSSKKSKSPSTKKDTKKLSINSKDTSTENVNSKRVPVIHVEGSKESPINVQIINSIKLEEDDNSDAKNAAKRKQGKCDKANKRLATGYSVKNYDPESSDESWICIFCKLSAHSPGLAGEPTGELFGPYFLQAGNEGEFKRHSRKTDHTTEPIKKKKSKKQKRSLSTDSNHTTSNSSEHKSVEIWAHENCFVWAPGVHLVGSKLVGLEDAVTESLKTVCAHCGQKGASIGCRARHCKSIVHYSCALYTGWNLNPETFIAVCYLHKGTQ